MNVYEIITDRIIQQLEKGTAPWRRPWRGGDAERPCNLTTGRPYRGINVFLLASLGYPSPYFVTYKQAELHGGQVRRGEKGSPVIFWRWNDKEDAARPGKTRLQPVIRYYTVFHLSQCDGIADPTPPAAERIHPLIPACETILGQMPAAPAVHHGAVHAYYRPSTDTVHLPGMTQFDSAEGYYATLFHELSHATGHQSRLGRRGVVDEVLYGSHAYSKEELIAEMSAAFLCGHTGIEAATLDNTAAYLAGWLAVLRSDSRMVIQAAAAAQKAADFILDRAAEAHDEAAAAA